MGKKNQKERALPSFCTTVDSEDKAVNGLTAAQIGAAYKATLLDFVRGETSRGSVATISNLLKGALETRAQELREDDDRSAQRVHNFY